jgi:hypothetical protein
MREGSAISQPTVLYNMITSVDYVLFCPTAFVHESRELLYIIGLPAYRNHLQRRRSLILSSSGVQIKAQE